MEEGVYKETAVSYNRIQQIRTTAEILYKNSKRLEFYWLTEQSNHLNYLRNTLQLIHIPSAPTKGLEKGRKATLVTDLVLQKLVLQ